MHIDEFEAAATMTRYLISLGHRRIGSSAAPNHRASAERMRPGNHRQPHIHRPPSARPTADPALHHQRRRRGPSSSRQQGPTATTGAQQSTTAPAARCRPTGQPRHHTRPSNADIVAFTTAPPPALAHHAQPPVATAACFCHPVAGWRFIQCWRMMLGPTSGWTNVQSWSRHFHCAHPQNSDPAAATPGSFRRNSCRPGYQGTTGCQVSADGNHSAAELAQCAPRPSCAQWPVSW